MLKKTVVYEVIVHSIIEDPHDELSPAPECQVTLQRTENVEQAIQYALQIFASSICNLVTVSEFVDGEFTVNKVSLCR